MLHSDIAARVVLMCGVSGSGKTFFSRKLEKNGYVRLSVDELLWELYGPMSHSVPLEEQRVMIAGAMLELKNCWRTIWRLARGWLSMPLSASVPSETVL